MSKFVFVAFLFLITSYCSAQNIADLETFEKNVKPGTQLIYDVSTKLKDYKLTLTIKKLGDEIVFDWKTSDPDNKAGTITMSAGATQNAAALVTELKPGDAKLDNETAIWISKKIFKDVATTAQAVLKLNGVADTVTTLSNTIGEFNFNLDGNLMAIPGWELSGGPDNKYIVDVLESKFPLIYKLNLDWSMILTEVKNP
jgi:hypothetical protein